jgi:hypothetical protein
MQYLHKIQNFKSKFSSILEEELDLETYEVNYYDRTNQSGIQVVNIYNMNDALLLLDYISTYKRTWDKEPPLCIKYQDYMIFMHARGNFEQIDELENGDCIIIDEQLRKIIKDSFLYKK